MVTLYHNVNVSFQLEKKNERGETLLQVAVIGGDLLTAKRLINKVYTRYRDTIRCICDTCCYGNS